MSMMQGAVIIQRGESRELLLLFHGVGSNADDLRPLGQALAERRPRAWIVSVQSPGRSESGAGWQWFSVQGITEANRPARVAAAMPAFLRTVEAWQRESGVDPAGTTLIGFSQGAIMALESTQQGQPLARRVVAIAGRFAQPPRIAPMHTIVHLMHGEQDGVIPATLAIDAAERLQTLGAQVTCDMFPGLGHGIDHRVLQRMANRLDGAGP